MMTVMCAVSLILAGALSVQPAVESPLKPPHHGGVYVVAHRGAHEGIPENTLAAYRKGIELGVDYVEIDVRTTSDGEFVSCHNGEIDNYAKDGTKGEVAKMTLAELKAVDIGSRVGPEWKDERIPTFDEILDVCQGKVGIYLDLKAAPIEPLIEKIKAHGMEEDVLWYVGSGACKRILAACPTCIPMPDPGPEKNLDRLIEAAHPRVIASTWKYLTQDFVDTCHANNAIVIVDESGPTCWQQALEWNTDGIQTDHPAALIEFLDKHAAAATPKTP